MQRHFFSVCLIAFLLSTALVMSACGKKGPLYMPDDAKSAPTRSIPAGK